MGAIYNQNVFRAIPAEKAERYSSDGCKCKKECYHFNNVLPKLAVGAFDFSSRYCNGEYSSCKHYCLMQKIAVGCL